MLKIVTVPANVLTQPTKPVVEVDDKIKKIVYEMEKVLTAQNDPPGVGLAANQVGLPYKIFLARFSPARKEPIRVFINPEILTHSKEEQEETNKSPLEGCLSLPKYYGLVKRFKWVELKYQDEKGDVKTDKFEDFPAIVIQHEMDHLDGKIFVERILEQKGRIYKIIGRDKQGKDEWEEVEL